MLRTIGKYCWESGDSVLKKKKKNINNNDDNDNNNNNKRKNKTKTKTKKMKGCGGKDLQKRKVLSLE